LTVTVEDLVADAQTWGAQSAVALNTISSLAAHVASATDGAVDKVGFNVPAAVIERVRKRTTHFA